MRRKDEEVTMARLNVCDLSPRSHERTHWVLAALTITALLFGLSRPSSAAAPTFHDETFNNSDWTSVDMGTQDPGETTAFLGEQVTDGGNPGAFRRNTITFGDHGGAGEFACLRQGAVWDPARQGAISQIDFSYDLLKFAPEDENYSACVSLVLFQDDSYYISAAVCVFASPTGWRHFEHLDYEGFFKVSGPGPFNPVLTAAGGPIQFGYSVTYPGSPNQPARVTGIDNWQVTINGGGGGGSGVDLTGSWRNPLVFTCSPATAQRQKDCSLDALTVRNAGDKKAKASKVDFYLSQDGVFNSATDTKVGSLSVKALKAGASKTFTLKFNLPKGVSPKMARGLFVIAVLDSKRKITETDETNNVIVSTPIP